MINLVIIHYNTPLLTECLVKSINKFTPDSKIFIFDNSDEEPFTYRQDNIVYLDNTKGQYINFDKWLENFPNRFKSKEGTQKFGSAKHCISVEKCMEIIGENFILLDSDILLKKDISCFYDPQYIFVGTIEKQPKVDILRVLPYVCFINVDICKQQGVHYFDEYRMHGLYNNIKVSNGDKYDTGAAFYYHAKFFPYKKIDYRGYIEHFKGGSWEELSSIRGKRRLTSKEWLKRHEELWGYVEHKVVYTCITGGYDLLRKPSHTNPDYKYICFTDQKITSSFWEIRPLPKETEGLSDVKKQRYVKVNAHKVLPPYYNLSVWIDGNVDIKGDINEYIKNNWDKKEYSIAIGTHPERNCVYDEVDACVLHGKGNEKIMRAQVEEYKAEGMPEHFGLPQTCIMFRRHQEPECIELMEDWWGEIKDKSHRDQLSISYVSWKNPDSKIQYLDKSIFNSKYFLWTMKHRISRNEGPKAVNGTLGYQEDAMPIMVKPTIPSQNSAVQRVIEAPKTLIHPETIAPKPFVVKPKKEQPKKMLLRAKIKAKKEKSNISNGNSMSIGGPMIPTNIAYKVPHIVKEEKPIETTMEEVKVEVVKQAEPIKEAYTIIKPTEIQTPQVNIVKTEEPKPAPKTIIKEEPKPIIVPKQEPEVKKTRVLLCAIGKLENKYIREWVEYHKNMGFTNIVLYDNNDVDGERFTDVIDDYVKCGFVKIESWRGVKLAQVPSYNNCYQTYKDKYDWICFWDIDEFVTFEKHKNIIDFLDDNRFRKTQCIRLCWKQYTDNGLIKVENGDYSIKRFREVFDINYCKKSNISLAVYSAVNGQCKSIYRTNVKNFVVDSPHCYMKNIPAMDATGALCQNDGVYIGTKSVWSVAWLNHYRFRTLEEYIEQKMVRLWPTEYGNGGKDILNIDYFFKFNKKTPEKEIFAKEKLKERGIINITKSVPQKIEVIKSTDDIRVTSWVKRNPYNGLLFHNNWGDELNYYIMPLMFNRQGVDYKKDGNENYACIGSILNDVFIDENTIVWGAGTQDINMKLTKQPKKVCAVRGPLTRKFLMDCGIDCPEIYGDPALLLPRYYHPKIEKKYHIGFIPHWESIESEAAKGFASKEGVHMIKMKGYNKWTGVIDEMLACDYIISESLHGLIIAEAYGIPNLWGNVTLKKYDVKFHDFFLSIGLDRKGPIPITKDTETFMMDIYIRGYKHGHINLQPLIDACPISVKETPKPVPQQKIEVKEQPKVEETPKPEPVKKIYKPKPTLIYNGGIF